MCRSNNSFQLEVGKYYWVQFGYGVIKRKCLAVTPDGGGIFQTYRDTELRAVIAEAVTPSPWWKFWCK